MIEDDQSLDLRAREVASRRRARLPAEHTEPSSHVADEPLCARCRELGDPMILSASGRSHGSHLSHGDDSHAKPEECGKVDVDDTGRAAVGQAEGRGRQLRLPRGHEDHGKAEGGVEGEVALEGLGFAHALHIAGVDLGAVFFHHHDVEVCQVFRIGLLRIRVLRAVCFFGDGLHSDDDVEVRSNGRLEVGEWMEA